MQNNKIKDLEEKIKRLTQKEEELKKRSLEIIINQDEDLKDDNETQSDKKE